MRRSSLFAVGACAATLLLLHSHCECNTAQAANGPEVKQAEQEEIKPDPRFHGIPVEHHAYLNTLETDTKTKRLMDSWFELKELLKEANRCAEVFGIRERKRARAKLPKLAHAIEKEKTKFYKEYDKVRDPIVKAESRVKDRTMDLSMKKGALNDPKVNKRVDELYDEAFVMAGQLNALTALQAVFIRSNAMPTDFDLLGINTKDSITREVAESNPEIIEARLAIKDCEADIARLEAKKAKIKEEGGRWSSSDDAKVTRVEKMLEKAVANLERVAARAKLPYEREAAKAEKKVQKTYEKIEVLEKRGAKTAVHFNRLADYDSEMSNNLRAVGEIDKLTVWKKEDKKAPAKPAPHNVVGP